MIDTHGALRREGITSRLASAEHPAMQKADLTIWL
jgi:hypothetical protein